MPRKVQSRRSEKVERETPEKGRAIVIPGTKMEGLLLSLEGTTPLIVHKFSEKAKGAMRDKRAQTATKTDKPKKDAAAIAEDVMSCHLAVAGNEHLGPCEGRFGFRSSGFKGAAVRAASLGSGIKMTEARIKFFVTGEVVPIACDCIEPREDAVRVGKGVADLRYRPYYFGWKAQVGVRYNPNGISVEQIVSLFDAAGQQVGIGENRPGKTGDIYGQWKIVDVRSLPVSELPDYSMIVEDNDMLAKAREIARTMGAVT